MRLLKPVLRVKARPARPGRPCSAATSGARDPRRARSGSTAIPASARGSTMQRTNALGSSGMRRGVHRIGPGLEPRLARPVVVRRALRLDADRAEQEHADARALMGVQDTPRRRAGSRRGRKRRRYSPAGSVELARHQRAGGGYVDQLETQVVAFGDRARSRGDCCPRRDPTPCRSSPCWHGRRRARASPGAARPRRGARRPAGR